MTLGGDWEQVEPGVARRLVALGGRLMAMEVRFEEGARGKKHSHPHEQLSRLMEGRMTFFLGEEARDIQAGDYVLVSSGLEHSVVAHEPSLLLDIFTPLRDDLLTD